MKALVYETFQAQPEIQDVDDPAPPSTGVVIKVEATGVCRSDWHGWMGHDSDVVVPHVPGHEFAGIIEAVGHDVTRWSIGDRVTMPFVAGCGTCDVCAAGDQQVCPDQYQPGFNGWGSFAEYVAVDFADANLVRLPSSIDFATAASLGCRFATSFRAIVAQGRVRPGQWVVVHGCGGVGLSSIMIAKALGAAVIAIDIDQSKLEFAKSIGAVETINARECDNVVEAILDLTDGGAHVSIDALGSQQTCNHSIMCLRPRGRHIQVGLLLGEHASPEIPMGRVIAKELEIYGSHGMQAYAYADMLRMIEHNLLQPDKLIGQRINLSQAADALTKMDSFKGVGMTVIDRM